MALWWGIAGAAFIVGAAFVYDGDTAFPGWAALFPVMGTVLLLVAGDNSDFVARTLSFKPLRWMGDLSYSWYLWHWPLIVFAPVVFPDAGPWLFTLDFPSYFPVGGPPLLLISCYVPCSWALLLISRYLPCCWEGGAACVAAALMLRVFLACELRLRFPGAHMLKNMCTRMRTHTRTRAHTRMHAHTHTHARTTRTGHDTRQEPRTA